MHNILKLGLALLTGCSLHAAGTPGDPSGGENSTSNGGNSASGGENSTTGSHQGADLYRLVPARSVGAEREIFGVDADGQGGLWLAYSTAGSYALNQKPVVTLVHWDPTTRQRLQTFTYGDLWSPVSGLAFVHGQVWLNYKDVATPDHTIQVIDPTSGAVIRTLGTTGIELAAMCQDRVLVSGDGVLVLDASSGGAMTSFSSATVLHPDAPMGGISFSDTQQGVAWRPGEIWVGNWQMPMEIFSESGQPLGKVDLKELRSSSAYPTRHLAFDRGQLLVGASGQLTWYDVR